MVGLSVFLFWLLGLVVFLSLPPGLLSIMAQLAGAPRSARKHLNAHCLFSSLFGRYRHGLGVVAVLDVVGLEAVLDQRAAHVGIGRHGGARLGAHVDAERAGGEGARRDGAGRRNRERRGRRGEAEHRNRLHRNCGLSRVPL